MPRHLAALILFLVLTLAALARAETVDLEDRWYRIDLPAEPRDAPILLALHGGGGSPDQFARSSGLSAPALAQGYAVIYPAGSSRFGPLLTWNAGDCCAYAARAGIDDLAFLDAVVADARARFGLSGDPLYLVGMSNGSMLAEAYAATRPAAVRAVAGVSGTLDLGAFPPTGSVALLHIHGTADKNVPYHGGTGPDAWTDTDFDAVPAVIAAFLAVAPPLTRQDTVIDPVADGTRVLRTDWLRGGVVHIRLLTVEGGGHLWPGGIRARAPGATRDIVANDEILAFFAAHP